VSDVDATAVAGSGFEVAFAGLRCGCAVFRGLPEVGAVGAVGTRGRVPHDVLHGRGWEERDSGPAGVVGSACRPSAEIWQMRVRCRRRVEAPQGVREGATPTSLRPDPTLSLTSGGGA